MNRVVYYLTKEGVLSEPLSANEILGLRDSGALSPETRIRVRGVDGWMDLSEFDRTVHDGTPTDSCVGGQPGRDRLVGVVETNAESSQHSPSNNALQRGPSTSWSRLLLLSAIVVVAFILVTRLVVESDGGSHSGEPRQAAAANRLSPEQQLVRVHFEAYGKLEQELMRLRAVPLPDATKTPQAKTVALLTSLSDGYRRLAMRVDDLDPLSDGALRAFNDSFRKMVIADSTFMALMAEFSRRYGGDAQRLSTSLRFLERGLRVWGGDLANPAAETVAELKDADEISKQLDEANATILRTRADWKQEGDAYQARINKLFRNR